MTTLIDLCKTMIIIEDLKKNRGLSTLKANEVANAWLICSTLHEIYNFQILSARDLAWLELYLSSLSYGLSGPVKDAIPFDKDRYPNFKTINWNNEYTVSVMEWCLYYNTFMEKRWELLDKW